MNGPLDSDNQDRALWRQYAARARNPQTPQVDANTLAAYLDGSAEPNEVELVEARMAVDPAFVDQVMALRQMADLESTPAPTAVLSRAKGLTRRHIWRPRMRWAAAAAAVMLASLAGYNVGHGTVHAHQRAQSVVSSRAPLEMDELISEPTLAIFLPINGKNGS
jgi:anti-sigma factor RsiW